MSVLHPQDILDRGYQALVLDDAAETLTMQNAKPGTALHEIYYTVSTMMS